MEKMLVDYSKEEAGQCISGIGLRYSPACVRDEFRPVARVSQLRSLERSLPQWGPETGSESLEQEPKLSPDVQRMSEFARRIEESAESSTAWARLGGEELSALRQNLRNLLRQVLNDLDQETDSRMETHPGTCLSAANSDIILVYRFACLLSAAVASSDAAAAVRVEVGFRMRGTELTCFVADRSAGVTIRKNDNLFALCTNGDWRSARTSDVPSLASIHHVVENFGGQLTVDSMDGARVKVSFAV